MPADAWPAGPTRRASAVQRPEECGGLGNSLPGQRSQRESAHGRDENGNGQDSRRAQSQQRPAPRAGRGQPGTDSLQAILSRLDRVRRRMQRAPQLLLVVMIVLAHASRPSTSRSTDMARAVWVLTAPSLMSITAAAWAADRFP